MRAITLSLAFALACGAAQAQAPAPAPKKTMAPASGVLERDLRLFESWFPGDFDNAEQVFFAEEQGVTVPRRLHARIAATGPHAFRISYFAANDLTKPVEVREVTAAVDAETGGLKLSSPGCDIRWTRRANQFAGEAQPGSCGAKAVTRFVLSAEDLWLGDDTRLRRAREWSCWMAVPREGKPDSWFSAFNLKLSDQGGEVWVKTDEATPREIGYRLRQVQWPAGTNQDALTLYVLKRGERAPGYAWASPDATRIGINLRWVQGSCSRPGG
jgi:hypothetical protein